MSKRILLVEDGPSIQKLLCHFLSKTPYTVDVAENGEEALKMFRCGAYSLVLMDMEMPVLDGIEACKKIRAIEKEKGCLASSIVALTANEFSEGDHRLKEAGYNGYIQKPVKERDFLEAVEGYLRA